MNSLTETVRAHTLEAIKVRCCSEIPADILRSIRINVRDMADYAAEGLLVELEAFIYGERAQHTLRISRPATWWQHFKEDCFPGWLQQRFPVRYEQVRQTVEAARMFPHAPAPRRNVGDPVLRILEWSPQRPKWGPT